MPAFLLDTNVVSELVRARPEQRVLDWVAAHLPADLYLSAITLGELIRGIAKLPTGRRRSTLRHWLDADLRREFEGRILAFDQSTAAVWGDLMGEADRRGRPRAAIDAQIAATARQHDLTLVTRNTADFAGLGVRLLDPWGD
ncbi:MAG: type II toxin-antitoxin system VapC family toxin [Geminicoccaceae bacterium]